MAIFDDNVTLLGGLFSDQEFTGRGLANTSRLSSSGTPEADPSSGLPAGYIWVRRQGARSSSRAIIGSQLRGWERVGNLLVEVGLNRGGELVAIKPVDSTEAVITYGNVLSTAPAQGMYIDSRQITQGLVTAVEGNSPGLNVYVQPLAYKDKIIQGAVDVTASIPTNADERRISVIAYDVSDDELVVINGTATTAATPFTLENVVAIALGDTDRIRLGAVELTYGMTEVSASNKFIDCRDWLTLEGSGVQSVVAGTNVTVDNTDPQNPIVSASGGGGAAGDYIHLQDQKTQNTSGGSATAGSWQTRDLNTEVVDTGTVASVGSNQVTLAAGTYRLKASAAFFGAVGRNRLRWRNVTDSTDAVLGQNYYGTGNAHITGRFTIAGTKTFELQYRLEATPGGSQVLGVESNWDVEIYADVELWVE